MTRIHTLVIGGGQAGLAMSRCLVDRGIEHVVLERGRVAERWRSERWPSLTLLTPNWQSRLPGWGYDGPDPDGFMTMPEVIGFFERYARSFAPPLRTGVSVERVTQEGRGFRVETSSGSWHARHVVIATGYSDRPFVPRLAAGASRRLHQVTPARYTRPEDLPDGGVLVVGASATGVQLAEEIHLSGRPVTLAVGRHLRLPRAYRGRDILAWFDALGILEESVRTMFDAAVSRRQPSLQLVGRSAARPVTIRTLRALGVRLMGRLVDLDREQAAFDDQIVATSAASDLKLVEMLGRIDCFIDRHGLTAEAGEKPPIDPTWPVAINVRPERLDLAAAGIDTILWATGFRRQYPWLRVPVLDACGEIRHREGITSVPGLYVLGMHLQRRRNSAFIDGVGGDARMLAEHMAAAASPARASA